MSIIEFNRKAVASQQPTGRALVDPIERIYDHIPPLFRDELTYNAVRALWDYHVFDSGKTDDIFRQVGGTIKRNVHLFTKYQSDFDLGYHATNSLAAWLTLQNYDLASHAESWRLLKPWTLDLLDGLLILDTRNPTPIMRDVAVQDGGDKAYNAALEMLVGLRNEIELREDTQKLQRQTINLSANSERLSHFQMRHYQAMRILTESTPTECQLAINNRLFAHNYVMAFRHFVPRHLRLPNLQQVI